MKRSGVSGLAGLRDRLERLDGRGYKAYKAVRGVYSAPGYRLHVAHVQGDPFAEPSRLRAILSPELSSIPDWALKSAAARVATADFLNRRLHDAFRLRTRSLGSGRSGELRVLRPSQEVLERTSLRVEVDGTVEARFGVGLPARGRRVAGREAADLLGEDVPAAVEESLRIREGDHASLRRHVETVEDARALREQLSHRGLVAFIADGSMLPRASGIDDRPLASANVVPFRSPVSLRVTLQAPHSGAVSGMGVPAGVTLIVGGGFHGKSTLLRALERGVYDHAPGDGREQVVTVSSAVKVRAEDGRGIAGADISNFIGSLPGGIATDRFITANASGSTSQAAAIVEALEMDCKCLLLDEDTSATNFMIRDARMQALIARSFEPITAFIDRARQLAEHGVSTVLVVGGSGDYFDVADTVIAMRAYEPSDVTAEAKRVAEERPTHRVTEAASWRACAPRVPVPRSIDPRKGRRGVAIRIWSRDRAGFGEEEVALSAVEQLVEAAQVRAIAYALASAVGGELDGRRSLGEALAALLGRIDENGLQALEDVPRGDLAAFRIFELAAFLGRLRSLETRPPQSPWR